MVNGMVGWMMASEDHPQTIKGATWQEVQTPPLDVIAVCVRVLLLFFECRRFQFSACAML
jgi:hypothetical protein